MEKDWIVIYSTSKAYQAEMLKQILKENGILSDIINKKDSSFQFGDIELYVHKQNEEKALALVKDFKG